MMGVRCGTGCDVRFGRVFQEIVEVGGWHVGWFWVVSHWTLRVDIRRKSGSCVLLQCYLYKVYNGGVAQASVRPL